MGKGETRKRIDRFDKLISLELLINLSEAQLYFKHIVDYDSCIVVVDVTVE